MPRDRTDRTPKKRGSPPAWRQPFLDELAKTCNVTAACRAASVARSTVYEARESDDAFAAAWDDAEEQGVDELELEGRRRAKDGTQRPVFYEGKVVGGVQEYSDTLLIFLLKAHRPEKYRENVAVEHSGHIGVTLKELAERARRHRESQPDTDPS